MRPKTNFACRDQPKWMFYKDFTNKSFKLKDLEDFRAKSLIPKDPRRGGEIPPIL
jgi:hypothetical protein